MPAGRPAPRVWHDAPMDRAHHLAALRRDADGLAAVVAAAPLDTAVPSRPGSTLRDVAAHVAEVHAFWATVVAERLTDVDAYTPPARPADDELLTWYTTRQDALIDALTEATDDTEVWTWTDDPADHNVGVVLRRMAQETAIHRWDVERAVGNEFEIDPEEASEAIDDFLFHFLDTHGDQTPWDGSVHLHCTDVDGEWLVVPDDDDQPLVSREHAKGAAALRGPAMTLLLALWRRVGTDHPDLDVVGDPDVARRFLAATRLS